MGHQTQFLVVGPQRSGTTIFGEILQRHQDICLTVDGKLLYYLLVWLVNDPTARAGLHPRLDEIAHALSRRTVKGDEYNLTQELIEAVKAYRWHATRDIDVFESQVAELWKSVYRSVSKGALAVGDKYNEYMLYGPDIDRLFPRMRYIVLNRERAHSARSAREKFESRAWQPGGQQQAEEKIDLWRQAFDNAFISPDRVLRVQFEAFCDAPEAVLAEVCDFLSLPMCPEMLQFADQILDPNRAFRWRGTPVAAAAV
ncbi:MAG: sulfotransferase [Pseudomonadota bacterium]